MQFTGAADAVPQGDNAAVEPALIEQHQITPHAVGKESLSTAGDRWTDDHLELVDKVGPYRLSGEFRTVDGNVALGVRFETPDRIGIELSFNARPGAARRGKSLRVNYLLSRLPLSRPLKHEMRVSFDGVR